MMRVSDLAIIFFSLFLILISLYFYSGSLSDRNALLEEYRFDYDSLCPGPLFSPMVSFSTFFAVHQDESLNLSVLDWDVVYSCVSFDGQIIKTFI